MTKKTTLANDFDTLEVLVKEIESGETDLEESLTRFKEGLVIAKRIKKELTSIETQVEEINKEFSELSNEK